MPWGIQFGANHPNQELFMPEIRDIWLHAHKMIRTARQIINENLHPLNLSSAEGNILLHLLTQGQEIPQEQLVEQLDISKPAVSRALDSLANKGYIMRKRDPGDKRAHRVCLTEAALHIRAQVEQAYNQVYALAVQGISPQELNDFLGLFGRISENLSREPSTK